MSKVAHGAVSLLLLGAVTTGQSFNLLAIKSPISNPVSKPATTLAATASALKPAAAPATPPPVMVTVNEGDSLTAIAEAHGTTYDRLFDANDSISDPNVINPGQQLRIPAASEQLPDRIADLPPAPVVSTPATTQTTAVTASYVKPAPTPVYTPAPVAIGDDATAKAFIYSRESGNNPNATNPSGCYGLGQDCNGRVRAQCGADYACQDAYFTNYAVSRYGSWTAAAAFWQTHGWW